jgi:protein-histidine pros-kinase
VPAYAATEQFNDLRKTHADYFYKEATLNPTNPRDRAADWEADVVNGFRAAPQTPEAIGVRETTAGPSLYLARPIQIRNPACLDCHNTAAQAPKTQIDLYGGNNGFGWKLNEVIGAQIVSVPMTVPIERANRTLRTFLLSLAAVFVATMLLLNLMLQTIVIRRITRLARIADEVSLGNLEAGEFRSRSRDEIGTLTDALARMKTSLVQAMKMLEG